MIGMFLGAGFSKWAADLPLVCQLFDFKINPFGVREEAKLQLVIKLKETWDKEYSDYPTEKFIADALSFCPKNKQAVLWYIVRRLSDSFIWTEYHSQKWRRHVLMIDENRKYKIEGVKRAQKFLQRFKGFLSGLITTNYDLLVEYALGTKGFNYGIQGQRLSGRGSYPVSQLKNPVFLKGNVSLAKIHGSISWDNTNYYTDGRRGITGNALIVAPIPEKNPKLELEKQWNLSAKILCNTSHLMVFGFAFNPYDKAVLHHLKENGNNIKSVILIDLSPNMKAAQSLWSNANIYSSPPPPEGNEVINNWIQTLYRV